MKGRGKRIFKRGFAPFNPFSLYLDAYLDELEWCFNNRDNPYLFGDILLQLIQSEDLSYQELVH